MVASVGGCRREMWAGFTVETVIDGAAALERVPDGGPRLVITDWEMPGISGVDLCRAVRESDIGG